MYYWSKNFNLIVHLLLQIDTHLLTSHINKMAEL